MGKLKDFVKKYDEEIITFAAVMTSMACGSLLTRHYIRQKCAYTFGHLTPTEHERIAKIHIMEASHKREFQNLVDGFTKTS